MGPAQTIAGGLVGAVEASRLRFDRYGSKRLNAAKGEACKLYIVTAGERQGNGYSAEVGGKFAAGYWARQDSESCERVANGGVKKFAELPARCALSK